MTYDIKVTCIQKGKPVGLSRSAPDKIAVAKYITENYTFGLWGDSATIVINKK